MRHGVLVVIDEETMKALLDAVVTSASHDLALAWHPVLSSSSPLLSFSSLHRRTYTTQTELFTTGLPFYGCRDRCPESIPELPAGSSYRAATEIEDGIIVKAVDADYDEACEGIQFAAVGMGTLKDGQNSITFNGYIKTTPRWLITKRNSLNRTPHA
jgi:hypothetical protein